MNTVVLDIETKNTLGDVGGKHFLHKLNMSVVGIYSAQKNEYICYDEDAFPKLKKFLSEPAQLVGFSMNKFDLPLLNQHLGLSLFDYPRVDISDEIEIRTGRLISLDNLAKLNLGIGKTHHNLMAPELYNAGKFNELKAYCLNDVKITKDLFDLMKKQNFLLIPAKEDEGAPVKVEIRLEPLGF